jgi:hypothetical protein
MDEWTNDTNLVAISLPDTFEAVPHQIAYNSGLEALAGFFWENLKMALFEREMARRTRLEPRFRRSEPIWLCSGEE